MTTKRKYKNYTDGTTTVHVYDGDNPPEGFWRGRHTAPWNKGLSAKTDKRVKANVETAHAARNRQYHAAWNKGLTKETDARVASYAQCLANDLECINKLSMWQKKAETSRYYKNAIYTWTDLDVRKLHTAIENKLNFEFIY